MKRIFRTNVNTNALRFEEYAKCLPCPKECYIGRTCRISRSYTKTIDTIENLTYTHSTALAIKLVARYFSVSAEDIFQINQ